MIGVIFAAPVYAGALLQSAFSIVARYRRRSPLVGSKLPLMNS